MESNTPENTPPEHKPASATPPPPASGPSISSGPVVETSKEARNFGMLCHITSLAGILVGGFGNWIGPLVIWLLKKEQYPFVDDQGKEALNFQITCLIGYVIGFVTMLIFIGFLVIVVVGLYWLIFTIIAAVKASEGVAYRYPFCLRLLK